MLTRSWLLAAGVLLLGACQEMVSAGERFPAADIPFLAEALDASGSGVLDGLFAPDGPVAAPAQIDGSGFTREITFTRARPCQQGGTIVLAGTLTRFRDNEAGTYNVEGSGTKTRSECTFARRNGFIAVTGVAEWTHERHYADGEPTGLWTSRWEGGFEWSLSTAETGECTHALERVVDTAENTVSLAGMLCGKEVDRSRKWRE